MSIPFYDREEELQTLIEAVDSPRAELVIIYGRRRIGKTTLVRRLLSERKGVYLYVEGSHVARFLAKASEVLGETFTSLDGFLQHVFSKKVDKPSIVVLDEYQRISRQLSPKLQYYWDVLSKESQVKLILTGSTVGMIERDIGYAGPLHGRATKIIKVDGFNYMTVRQIFNDLPEKDIIGIYATFGGTPHYLMLYDKSKSLRQNIRDLLLSSSSPLYEEVERLLSTELREPTRYAEILEAIAAGKPTLKEIADHIKLDRTQIKKYMLTLERLGLVEKEVNLFKMARPRYKVRDNFFLFHMRFINRFKDFLELGQVDYVLDEIMNEMPAYVGRVFEKVCVEVLSKLLRGFMVGVYWDREGDEIDVAAMRDGAALFFECKTAGVRREDAALFKGRAEHVAKKLNLKKAAILFLVPQSSEREVYGVNVIGLRELLEKPDRLREVLALAETSHLKT
ncbi:MAG: ATP-binding protein [Candidatus Caldarchaeum sp.]